MAKPASRKLKVFQAQIGFYDTVVAAPSRVAALDAWGVRQDLFAEKQAHQTEDAEAVSAALSHPGTPLKRPVGTRDPFEVEPGRLPEPPPAPKGRKTAKPKPRDAPEPPPPDRSDLDKAEKALHTLDERRRKQETALRRREVALKAEAQEAESAYLAEREKAASALAGARAAWRKAGGKD